MRRFLRLVLALFFSQMLLFLVGLFALGSLLRPTAPALESGTMLRVHLSGEIIEYPTLPSIPFLHREPLSQNDILECLQAAADDDRIGSVLVEIDEPDIGWGKATELHQAILRFRESGKPVVAHGPVLGEVGLLVGSACDSIYMPPTGRVFLNGLGVGPMYFKGTLDKLAIRPNVSRIGAYKDAVEPEIRRNMSAEAREQYEWLLDDLWSEFLETLESRRNLGRADLEEAVDRGILTPDEGMELGLLDGVRHREDVVRQYVRRSLDTPLLDVEDYRHEARHRLAVHGSKAIAVVHARGLILRGANDYAPTFGAILGASEVVRDLEDVADDKTIEAVVLRVDSPGGEIVASDMISHAVEHVRQRKPIVVSMVDVAASGGYMMSFHANRIVAQPTTITGSIGMLIEKFNMRGFYDKLGLSRDFVTRGSFPFLFSDYHDWSAQEESLIARQQWGDYERWIQDIAKSRKLEASKVDDLGRGRVWTGQQALEHGLLDELGGQERAVELARELAEIPAGTKTRLVHYPEERSFLDLLLQESDALWASARQRLDVSPRLPRGTRWSILELGFLP